MIWKVHQWGEDERMDEIVMRRFGSDHDKPCSRPEVITCSLWDCQVRDRCQYDRKR